MTRLMIKLKLVLSNQEERKMNQLLHNDTILKVMAGVFGCAGVIAPLLPEHTILAKVLVALTAVGASLGIYATTGREHRK